MSYLTRIREQRGIFLLTAVASGWFLALGVRLVFPVLIPDIQNTFDIGLDTAGLLLSLLWAAYALMQFPGGLFADVFGSRKTLTSSIVLTMVGCSGMFVSLAPLQLYASTALIGLGVGLFGTTRITILANHFPDNSGTVIGINQAAGNFGNTILPPLAGLIAVWIGWRFSFGLLLPLLGLSAVYLWIAVPVESTMDRGGSEKDIRSNIAELRVILTERNVICITVIMALVSFVYQSFTGFYPSYLATERGLSTETAATLFGLFFATAIVIQPLAGRVRDRVGTKQTLVITIGFTIVVLTILTVVRDTWALVLVSICASSQLAIWPITNSFIADTISGELQGSAVGIARTAYLLVGATGPIVTGYLAEVGLFDVAIYLLAGLLLITTVPTLLITGDGSK